MFDGDVAQRIVVQRALHELPCARVGCGHSAEEHQRSWLRPFPPCTLCACGSFATPYAQEGQWPVVLHVTGPLSQDAGGAVGAALRDLLDGAPRMRSRYFGAKRYEAFHQRFDAEYGMGPKHGSLVLSIGLQLDVRRRLADGGLLTPREITASCEWLAGRPLPPFFRTFIGWQYALATRGARRG